MKSPFLILLIALAFAYATAHAQNVVGTWKRTAMILTEANGKTEDLQPELTKAMPCTAGITHTFVADGTMRVDVPESYGAMKKTIERMNKAGRWSVSGRKLRFVVPDKSLPDSDYNLIVIGNTMIWDFDYATNPQMPNPTKAKRVVIQYMRL